MTVSKSVGILYICLCYLGSQWDVSNFVKITQDVNGSQYHYHQKLLRPIQLSNHLSIQNIKILSWARNVQNPNPKNDHGFSMNH